MALLAVMGLMYGLGFLATGGDLAIYRFWAPKMENAKRQVFENTQSYVQGKTEYIGRLRYRNDSRHWIPTITGDVHHGGREGDVYGRLVAVTNGRWMALPLLRIGERSEFLRELFAFTDRHGIQLTVWLHPATDLSGFAELIRRSLPRVAWIRRAA